MLGRGWEGSPLHGELVDATGGAHSNWEGCDSTTDDMKKTHSLQEEKSIWTTCLTL